MRGSIRYRKAHSGRRMFHVVIALILVFCVLSPFVESAIDWNDSVFSTGYDTETTLAVLVLLLEVVISFSGLLVCLCRYTQLDERVVIKHPSNTSEFEFGIESAELSPPPPLRI